MPYPPATRNTAAPTVKIGSRRDVALPEELLRTLRFRRGTKLQVSVSGDALVLSRAEISTSKRLSAADARWAKMEREADEDIARGNILGPFDTVEEAFAALRSAEV